MTNQVRSRAGTRAHSFGQGRFARRGLTSARLQRRWELEGYAAVVVLFLGGIEIEIGESDLARVAGRHIEQSGTDDRIVSDFEFVSVFEDENG
jgi:hypothetical protein